MEWFKHFERNLDNFATLAQFCLETISVICVVVGLLKTIQLAIALSNRHHNRPFPYNLLRLRFGIWLALALEFQLGADVLATTIAPTLEELAKLALIAVIRTFLNYFLGKELEVEYKLQRQRAEIATEQEPVKE
ncbi:DUF1622 domain-containing protein [Chlorogloeopsis fritschii PCC 9212]|uniref:Membrane protein n=1 Tax=Chlorogloeopsis fritschii PCC 6912 TaxID=211165 RepID=A0A433NDS5_CHLFR|nr:DUF1622 domain-containing protein [Chlorogloeopsis fritschii]MBF2007070.1 DUF1622 domain-containing protein [Chlorogloeopsis fritschii C42_A2020_084]RUR80208.1 membrane protein [Chlorogloeopsis fritschii PCC 6912]